MAIRYPLRPGKICICDFRNTIYPEICKKRPVIILNSVEQDLSIVVPCSTTSPNPVREWHYFLTLETPLPAPYDSKTQWVKCDLLMTVSHSRLQLPFIGKDATGKRIYDIRDVNYNDFHAIKQCVLNALAFKATLEPVDNLPF